MITDVRGDLHVGHARSGDLLVTLAVDGHLAALAGISLRREVKMEIFNWEFTHILAKAPDQLLANAALHKLDESLHHWCLSILRFSVGNLWCKHVSIDGELSWDNRLSLHLIVTETSRFHRCGI